MPVTPPTQIERTLDAIEKRKGAEIKGYNCVGEGSSFIQTYSGYIHLYTIYSLIYKEKKQSSGILPYVRSSPGYPQGGASGRGGCAARNADGSTLRILAGAAAPPTRNIRRTLAYRGRCRRSCRFATRPRRSPQRGRWSCPGPLRDVSVPEPLSAPISGGSAASLR